MNEKFRKKALRLVLLFCVIIPIINCLLFQGVYSYFIEGNILFGKSVEVLVSNVIDFIRNASVYCGYAVMIYATIVSDKKEARIFKLIRAVSLIIPYICAVAVLFLTLPGAAKVLPLMVIYTLLYTLLNLPVDLVVFAIICIITQAIKNKRKADKIELGGKISPKKNPLLNTYLWVCLIFAFVSLSTNAYTTFDLLSRYGGPANFIEFWTLAEPYIETAVYFLSGYILMIITANKLEGDYKKCQE